MIEDHRQKRLIELLSDPDCKVTYWCSDQWGGPANSHIGGHGADWRAYPGRIDEVTEGVGVTCSSRGLHGTDQPHEWRGQRVWIVALWRYVTEGSKSAGAKREIICEVTPEICIDPKVGVRLGLANLYGANLVQANLDGANLVQANLDGANLVQANLDGANLYGANLYGANLVQANLDGANLYGANLVQANLDGANLYGANLVRANLDGHNREDLKRRGAILDEGNGC